MTKDESRRAVAELDRQVGEQLKVWREANGMTQSDVGAVLGVSYQQVQKYERGIDRMSAGMLLRLVTSFEWTLPPAHGMKQG